METNLKVEKAESVASDAPAAVEEEKTLQDHINDLIATKAKGAEFSRTMAPNNKTVIVKFTWPNGDVVSGNGDSTYTAFINLRRKVLAFVAAMEDTDNV